jgi:GTP-binding protein
MFVDEARIRVASGGGGNGCMAFRREKFVPRGGPSGGDGGRGGDVLMESSEKHNTLIHFRFNPEYKAQRGRHGEGSNKTGAEGKDIVLKVPVGTIVYDDETGEQVHDFSAANERIVVARGGRGGRGNARFATSTHQAPRECEPGRPGEERVLRLELKLLADAGLLGYPNVGKSTLISRISAARPKIADYPFTTLQPNLGVVALGDEANPVSYVVADVPGLIEGASHGAGLGMQFLRHLERTLLLAHLIDVSDASGRPDPVKDFEVIMGELESFGAGLERKPMILVASKADAANPEKLARLRRFAKRKKLPFYEISSITGAGLEELKWAMANKVEEVRRAGQQPELPQQAQTRRSPGDPEKPPQRRRRTATKGATPEAKT